MAGRIHHQRAGERVAPVGSLQHDRGVIGVGRELHERGLVAVVDAVARQALHEPGVGVGPEHVDVGTQWELEGLEHQLFAGEQGLAGPVVAEPEVLLGPRRAARLLEAPVVGHLAQLGDAVVAGEVVEAEGGQRRGRLADGEARMLALLDHQARQAAALEHHRDQAAGDSTSDDDDVVVLPHAAPARLGPLLSGSRGRSGWIPSALLGCR